MGNHRRLQLSLLAFALISFSVSTAQTVVKERPKLKDFGSSLKQLRWDSARKAAVERPSKAGRKRETADDIVTVETNLVVCDVLVKDQDGLPIRGLTADDFSVTEDDVTQQVDVFALGNDAKVPRTIVLIIDHSGSQFPYLKTSIEAAKTLVEKLGPLDRMAIVTDDVELLLDFTSDKEKLSKKLDSLLERTRDEDGFFGAGRRLGRSEQYSALMATLREAFRDDDQRPIIIFQTDGDEVHRLQDSILVPTPAPGLPPDLRAEEERRLARLVSSLKLTEFSLGDVYKAAEKSRVTIYNVIPGYRLIGLEPDDQIMQMRREAETEFVAWSHLFPGPFKRTKSDQDERWAKTPLESRRWLAGQKLKVQLALANVATVTGGWTEFLEDPGQAPAIYSRILSDINERYIIGYYPSNKDRDGKRRRVKVEVRTHPEYGVEGRKSYYAPGP